MKTKVSRKHGEFLYGELTEKIIELAIKIHKQLGPGFIERIYEKALIFELRKARIKHVSQAIIRVQYEEIELGDQKVDLIVDDKIIVELKCVSELNEIHLEQILSYLKTANKRVGLLLNFSKPTLEIKRIVN